MLEVRELGLSIAADTSALELIAGATDELRERFRGADGDSTTSEFASLAARRALTETVGSFGGTLVYHDSQPPSPAPTSGTIAVKVVTHVCDAVRNVHDV